MTAAAFAGRGYSGGAQTRWLESTLAAARADASIDWIVVQLHQCACSSAPTGDGSDLGVRREWLPLFDTYEVDLVLSGHDHGYERSFPVRGFDAGGGHGRPGRRGGRHPQAPPGDHGGQRGVRHQPGHRAPGPRLRRQPAPRDRDRAAAAPGALPRTARVFTRPGPARAGPAAARRRPARPAADAVEAATWSARRDTSTGYGIAVFDVSPGSEAGGQTSITVRYYHAVGPDAGRRRPGRPGHGPGAPPDDYTLFETFTLVRPRSDGRRWHPKAVYGGTVGWRD